MYSWLATLPRHRRLSYINEKFDTIVGCLKQSPGLAVGMDQSSLTAANEFSGEFTGE